MCLIKLYPIGKIAGAVAMFSVVNVLTGQIQETGRWLVVPWDYTTLTNITTSILLVKARLRILRR